jgi:hypothetical protein
MQKQEFESLAGMKVSDAEYKDIERVYMSADGMGKQEFCVAWRDGKLAYIVDELVSRVESLERVRDRWRDKIDEAEEKSEAVARVLLRKAEELGDGELKSAAIDLVGIMSVTLTDVEKGYSLSEAERQYIIENL